MKQYRTFPVIASHDPYKRILYLIQRLKEGKQYTKLSPPVPRAMASTAATQGQIAYFVDQSSGTARTYGVLAGAIDGANCVFTVSQTKYATGSLVVTLNGVTQKQGTDLNWVETSPAAGTFTFNTAPLTNDEILVWYQLTTTGVDGTSPTFDDVAVSGDINQASVGIHYFGDDDVNGSWRFIRSGNDLLVQVRVGGAWVTSTTHSPPGP